VVIATRAQAPFLTQALASIAQQSLRADHVFVVCDVNDEPGAPWLADLKLSLPGVHVVQSSGTGMISAMNFGIGLSSSSYIAFLDSDDLWLPNKQAEQIRMLREDPELDAATGLAANFRMTAVGTPIVQPAHASVMFTSTTFRSDVFERFGQLDPDSTHFTWLYRWWGEARRSGIRTACSPYVGTHRRLHADNSWRVRGPQAHRELLSEVRRHAQYRVESAGTVTAQGPDEQGTP